MLRGVNIVYPIRQVWQEGAVHLLVIVFTRKGGVHKTTLTAHIAAGLARVGKRTAAVDLDPQGSLLVPLGLGASSSVYDMLTQPERPLQEFAKTFADRPGLYAFGANSRLAEIREETGDVFRARLEELRAAFDFVLVDMPPETPNNRSLTHVAIEACDRALVPVALESLSVKEGIRDLNQTFAGKEFGVVLTKVDHRSNRSSELLEPLKREYGERVVAQVPVSVDVDRAVAVGVLAWEYRPGRLSPYTEEIARICEWLLRGSSRRMAEREVISQLT